MTAPTSLGRTVVEQQDDVLRELIALPPDEVHVWHVPLGPLTGTDNSRLVDLLTDEERIRADRYKRIQDRDAFVSCRGALRQILGQYTGEDPCKLSITYSQWGKPQIEGVQEPFRFSVSHSHGVGVVALARGRNVGVDVEYIQAMSNTVELAEYCFSQSEAAQLKKLPEHQRLEGFYHCWTRKEAFAKALGKGLFLPFDTFIVSLVPGEPAELLDVIWDPQEVTKWCIRDLTEIMPQSPQDYAGAIAVEGHDWRLRYCQLEGPSQ